MLKDRSETLAVAGFYVENCLVAYLCNRDPSRRCVVALQIGLYQFLEVLISAILNLFSSHSVCVRDTRQQCVSLNCPLRPSFFA